jgi:hypothetical protein
LCVSGSPHYRLPRPALDSRLCRYWYSSSGHGHSHGHGLRQPATGRAAGSPLCRPDAPTCNPIPHPATPQAGCRPALPRRRVSVALSSIGWPPNSNLSTNRRSLACLPASANRSRYLDPVPAPTAQHCCSLLSVSLPAHLCPPPHSNTRPQCLPASESRRLKTTRSSLPCPRTNPTRKRSKSPTPSLTSCFWPSTSQCALLRRLLSPEASASIHVLHCACFHAVSRQLHFVLGCCPIFV